MSHPVLYESHCHTTLCNHAQGEPEEYALHAKKRGLAGIIFTCHAPLPNGFMLNDWERRIRMNPEDFNTYVEWIERAQKAMEGIIDVRLGLESDYYPGVEDWLKELHSRVPLHHVLGSVHRHLPDYHDLYFKGDVFEYQKLYYEHLALAAESGLFDTISHPDEVKYEDPKEWDFERIRPYIEKSLDRIAKTGVAMELNTSGFKKNPPRPSPEKEQLRIAYERNIPIVLGSDAHSPEAVGRFFEEGLSLMEEVGYQEVYITLDRKRQSIPIETAKASLIL